MKDMQTIEKRICEYWNSTNGPKKKDWLRGWGEVKKHVDMTNSITTEGDFKLLQSFGKNSLGSGYNASEYFGCIVKEDGEWQHTQMLRKHIDWQLKKYIELTGETKESLFFPEVCELLGYKDDSMPESNIIPFTAPRLGYYLSAALEFFKSKFPKKRKINVLEIGGGWGASCYLARKNKKNINVYAIVDIPTTIIVASYFLHRAGMKFILPNEIKDFSKKDFSKVDCVFLEPKQLKDIEDKFFDVSISTACLPELTSDYIDFYLEQASRLSNTAYIDATRNGKGEYLREIISLSKFKESKSNSTPITAYYPKWYNGGPTKEVVEEFYILFSGNQNDE